MDLKIVKVQGHGTAAQEFVLLRATADCDVGRYIVADNTYVTAVSVSNKLRHTYWFPDKLVKAGEYVSLWTGAGIQQTVAMDDGTPLHRFYWGLGSSVWNNTGDAITLIEAKTWSFQRVP